MLLGKLLERYVRLLIEIGIGIDLIGGDDNEAVRRAINDIIHRVCIPYFEEKKLSFSDTILVIDIYTPHPNRVHDNIVMETLPVKPGQTIIRKHTGGALISGLYGDITASIASITIYVPRQQ